MKKFLLGAFAVALSSAVFSQTDCPTGFTRNNGNGGTCASHVKLYFATCPAITPTLDSIKMDGVLQPESFIILGKTCNGSNTYIDYCVSDDNLVPAGRITVYLTYPDGSIGGSSRSVVCTIPSSGPMPVTLSSFDAQRNTNNNDVLVTWETQQENNSSSFEIERAIGNTTFQSIGSVAAAGTSGSLKTYTFSDKTNIGNTVSLYRIKMIDKDGAFTYSKTKTVSGSNAKFDFAIFPNPSNGNVSVTVKGLYEPADVNLIDMSGRVLSSAILNNTNTTQLNNLQNGIYFIRVTGKVSGQTSVKKLSVTN